AASAGSGSGIEIWNVANPSSPQRVMTGLDAPPTCGFDRRSTYGLAMWKGGTHYYLGLRTSNYACPSGPTVNKARIYDVSCIASGPCSLGNPVWSTVLPDEGTPNYFVTYSQSGASPFLYFGSDNKCSGGLQREWLFDVSNPAAARDITPPGGYWGWYYRGGLTGFNLVMPRRGKFVGNYFYRARLSIMDIHQHTGGVAPLADFSWSPTEIYPGTAVNFQDLSLPTPTSWSWTFQDGSPATSTTASPQGVTFATPGAKSVSLAVANSVGPGNTTKSVTVLDPTPHIGTAVVVPTSP